MELTVYKTDGSKTSKTVVLNEGIFAVEPNDHAIYLDVKQYLANQRQGTHKSKERSEPILVILHENKAESTLSRFLRENEFAEKLHLVEKELYSLIIFLIKF